MTFATNTFLLLFLPGVLVLAVLGYFLFKRNPRYRTGLLLAASLVFYLWAGLGAWALLAGMSVVSWAVARWVNKSRLRLGMGGVLLCLPLAAFKYTAFVVENINLALGTGLPLPGWALPLGISFYTFQALSMVVDTYRGQMDPPPFRKVLFYLTFFPTVVSGPIARYGQVVPQLDRWELSLSGFEQGLSRFVTGLAQKLLLADKLAPLADYYFNQAADGYTASSAGFWLGSIAYTLQIYFDFQGYTQMALGVGEMVGITLPQNFDCPYLATSVQDFWRRWHITLSRWFRDYIYIPMGGNRVSVKRHILNLLVVWMVTGIWHGANWTFLVWGLGYFCLLTAEKYGKRWLAPLNKGPLGWVYTIFWVNLLWVVFRSDSLPAALRYIAGMAGVGASGSLEGEAAAYLPLVGIAVFCCLPWGEWLARWKENPAFRLAKGLGLAALFLVCVGALASTSYTPFIYGNF